MRLRFTVEENRRLSARQAVCILFQIAVLAIGLLTIACAPTPATSSAMNTPAQPVAQTNDAKSLWQNSKHANTYVNEGAENNSCARCHAPMNWLPTSPDEMPATCASCKFTIKPPKPVAQDDWKNIECAQCHKTEKGVVSNQVMWLNALIAAFDTVNDPYEPVKSNTELCEKCHRDAYKIEMGTTAHKNLQCTDCHNPHSTAASCSNVKCHANVRQPEKPMVGHDAAHANVNCVACHDANGWKAQPVGDKKVWLTLKPTDRTGKANPTPFVSHNLQKHVDCGKCHFAGNQWGLKTSSAEFLQISKGT